jgi:hypothetical protein
MPKLTVAEIAEEFLKVLDLHGETLGIAIEALHNRVRAQEGDQEVATKDAARSLPRGYTQVQR